MSKNNKKVETTQESQTTPQVYKVPTGKVVTLEERKKRREEREKQYQNFRINALKRRCKRLKMSDEDTAAAVEKLKNQLNTPNDYNVLLLFNPNNAEMIKQALTNESIVWKIMGYNPKEESDGYAFIDADQETLATIREIVPPGTKVHPYVKKKPPVIECSAENKKKPSNNSKSTAAKAKAARKTRNISSKRKKNIGKSRVKKWKRTSLLELKKKRKATIIQLKSNKRSTGSKKASTELKKAA